MPKATGFLALSLACGVLALLTCWMIIYNLSLLTALPLSLLGLGFHWAARNAGDAPDHQGWRNLHRAAGRLSRLALILTLAIYVGARVWDFVSRQF